MESFTSIPTWLEEIDRYCDERVKKVLIGNKADVAESDRKVPLQMGEEFAAKYGMPFFETSAKVDNGSVKASFEKLTLNIHESRLKQQQFRKDGIRGPIRPGVPLKDEPQTYCCVVQ